jgi:hypothetical protein
LAEQVTLNHWVVGSIPTRCISFTQKDLQIKKDTSNLTLKTWV